MMHCNQFNRVAPVAGRCLIAIPARNLGQTFKGQNSDYLMCSMTGQTCRRGAHCGSLILEAIHKGLSGRDVDTLAA